MNGHRAPAVLLMLVVLAPSMLAKSHAEIVQTLEDEELPYYFRVTTFFELGLECIRDETEHEHFLAMIGVQPGTRAAEAVDRAIYLAAAHSRKRSHSDRSVRNDPDALRREENRWLRQRVSGHQKIYDELLSNLERESVDLAKIIRFIEGLKTSSIIAWNEPFSEEFLRIVSNFRRGDETGEENP